jgi:hypothetical protein
MTGRAFGRHALPAALAAVLCLALTSACRKPACLRVSSTPTGAAIWLDGENTGQVTDHLFDDLYAGLHLARVARDSFYWEDTLDLAQRDTTTVAITFPSLTWLYAAPYSSQPLPPAAGPDGTIYIAAGDSILALDSGGTVKWRRGFYSANGVTFCTGPAVGDRIFLLSYERLYAVGIDGTPAWVASLDSFQYYTPTVRGLALAADGHIYVSTTSGVYAFNPDGSRYWKQDLSANSVPVVGADATIYVAAQSCLYALNPNTGQTSWQAPVDSGYPSDCGLAIGADGVIYVTQANRLLAINPDGTRRWTVGGQTSSYGRIGSPAVGSDGSVTAVLSGELWRVAFQGSAMWIAPGFYPSEMPAPAPVLLADGSAVCGCQPDRGFGAVDVNGNLLWLYTTGTYPRWSSALALPGGVVCVSDNQTLYYFRIASAGASGFWPMFQHDPQRTGRASN